MLTKKINVRQRKRKVKVWEKLPYSRIHRHHLQCFSELGGKQTENNFCEIKSEHVSYGNFLILLHLFFFPTRAHTHTRTRTHARTHAQAHTHLQRTQSFKCANRRHKSSEGQMGNGLLKFTVTWNSVEFPNVKNHKGVSNFLVRLSSSSAHCWVNIREKGEEKTDRKEGRWREEENENEEN